MTQEWTSCPLQHAFTSSRPGGAGGNDACWSRDVTFDAKKPLQSQRGHVEMRFRAARGKSGILNSSSAAPTKHVAGTVTAFLVNMLWGPRRRARIPDATICCDASFDDHASRAQGLPVRSDLWSGPQRPLVEPGDLVHDVPSGRGIAGARRVGCSKESPPPRFRSPRIFPTLRDDVRPLRRIR